MDSSQAGLVQKSPNWKHFSLSGVGMWGERMREGTRGNREFTGESMPQVAGDFSRSGVGVLRLQVLARLLINHVTQASHCQCPASVSQFREFNAHSSVGEGVFQ